MTKVYWQGHEADAYLLGTTANTENIDSRDATYERAGMASGRSGDGSLYSRPDWPAQNEIWHRFRHTAPGGYNVGMVFWAAIKADGTTIAQIVVSDATHAKYQAMIGGVLTDVGAPFVLLLAGSTARFDVHHKGTAGGKIEVYYGAPNAQTKVVDATADYSGAGSIVRIFHGQSLAGGGYLNSVAFEMVQDTSTLSSTSEIKPPTSNGADVDGTGTWADVDEQTTSDADLITLNAVGQRQSFKAAARTQTQAVVTGITVSCRAWYEAGGPTGIKPYLTIAGVRYYGAVFALDLVPLAYQYTFDVNPATLVAFTTAEANAATLEWGWEAVA
jgi:hypothetical protein